MKYIKKLFKSGGSTGLILPNEIIKYLELEDEDNISIVDLKDEDGPFLILRKE